MKRLTREGEPFFVGPVRVKKKTAERKSSRRFFRLGWFLNPNYFFFRMMVLVCTFLPYLSVTTQYTRRPFTLMWP